MAALVARVNSDELKARLARGAASAAIINVIAIGVSFLTQLVLARVLGPAGYGTYAYAFAWVLVLALLASLGFNTALLRFVPMYQVHEEWSLLRGVTRFAERSVLTAGVTMAAAGLLVLFLIADRLEAQLVQTLFVGVLIVPVLALMRVMSSIVRALGGVVAALAPDLALRDGTVLVVVSALAFGLGASVTPAFAMGAMLAGSLLSLAIVNGSVRHRYPVAGQSAGLAQSRREWLEVSRPLLALHAATVLGSQAGVLMLGWLESTTSAGIYAVASRLALLVAFPLAMVNLVFAPTIAALHARRDRAGLQALVTTSAFWIALAAAVLALPLFVWPTFWLGFFGPAFQPGGTALRIIIVGQLVNAATGSVGFLMIMTGQERQALLIAVGVLSGQVALALALIPKLGIEGAAVAGSFVMVVGNVAAAFWVWRSLGIVPGPIKVGRRSG